MEWRTTDFIFEVYPTSSGLQRCRRSVGIRLRRQMTCFLPESVFRTPMRGLGPSPRRKTKAWESSCQAQPRLQRLFKTILQRSCHMLRSTHAKSPFAEPTSGRGTTGVTSLQCHLLAVLREMQFMGKGLRNMDFAEKA